MVILKYKIQVVDSFVLQMPKDAIPLSVQAQRGEPVMWAMMDSLYDEPISREFSVVSTGELFGSMMGRYQYIGTFQLLDGAFVGHLFEIVR